MKRFLPILAAAAAATAFAITTDTRHDEIPDETTVGQILDLGSARESENVTNAAEHVVALYDATNLAARIEARQTNLVSGVNIKTINGESILGGGDIEVRSGVTNAVTYAQATNIAEYVVGTNGFLKTELDPVWEASSNSFETALKQYADQYANQAPGYNAVSNRAMIAITNHQSLAGYATERWVTGKEYVTKSITNGLASTNWVANQGYLTTALQKSDVVNDLTTTTTDVPLSANMGYELEQQILNLKQRGRYLSIWNATNGLAETTATTSPYDYKAGDYFIVGTVAASGGTNYKPVGTQYTNGVPSRVVETATLLANDTYYFDGTTWTLVQAEQKEIAFASIAGQPSDNTNLKSALDAKQNKISDYTTTNAVRNIVTGYGYLTEEEDPVWNEEKGNYQQRLTGVEFDFNGGTNFTKYLYQNLTNLIIRMGGTVKNAPAFN